MVPAVDSLGPPMVNAPRMNVAAEATRSLAIRFGAGRASNGQGEEGIEVALPVPVLAGPATERIASMTPGQCKRLEHGRFQVLRHPDRLAGIAVCPIDGDLEAQSYACYRDLFALLGEDQHAYRVWHYVPQINELSGGLENYRIFNIGRRRAFDDHFGALAESQMPAASAVGAPDNRFVMAFVAGSETPRYLENPHQTPAYHYPQSYGPKSPSFARAAVADSMIYISGTASIRGHETVHQGDLHSQFDVTLENLNQLAQALGFASWIAVTEQPGYNLKVYLRHPRDLERLRPRLEEALHAEEGNTTILHTEICRADLDLEIEAMFSRPASF